MKLKFKQNIGMSVDIAVVNTAQKKDKVIEQKNIIENEATENKLEITLDLRLNLKQNIGMSVDIAVVNTPEI